MQVTVLVNGDTTIEPDETFTVRLSNAVGATITDADGTGTIVNDDVAFSINDVTQNEGNAGNTSFTFTVTKTGTTPLSTSVTYETIDGTAVSPGDFTAIPPTILNFGPSDSTLPVTVTVKGDVVPEPNETFMVHLSSPTNATISNADGLGTITNDDGLPPIVYVDDDWTSVPGGTDPDGRGPATIMGFDAFSTIQGGVDGVAPGGTVYVYQGTYNEDVALNKAGISVLGFGAGQKTVQGPIGGDPSTFHVLASNVTIAGFYITRLGNNTTDWNNPGLNTAGIAIQGQANHRDADPR